MTDGEVQNKLGEVLRTAREARDVDLARVERDTKIRARYLQALEDGDYAELPGAVYTKGFLRNYGAYLGLDAEYLIDLYRLESAQPITEKPSVPAPPRPISTRRSRPLVVTPGVIMAALLTVGVAIFIIYLVAEFVTFARTPDLVVSAPAGDVAGYDQMEYTIIGTTEPNSRITVEGLRENPTVTADAAGNFTIVVGLVPGSNVITLVALDPLTNRESEPVTRTIVVGEEPSSPSPGSPAVAFTTPEEGATVVGPVRVTGTAAPDSQVILGASLVEAAAPTIRIQSLAGQNIPVPNRRPSAPDPVRLSADAQGAIRGNLPLAPGTWDLTLRAEDQEPVTRRVTVEAGDGLTGQLRASGRSYLEIDQDGQPKRGVSGRNVDAGTRVRLAADESLRIRVGNAGVVRLVVNGIDLGAMGDPGAVVEWRITRR
ncbi:MAG TPA: RodZ domain-containing protein [Candidatus Limnocylindria bacterium]|nr:RodZ domain-containing protein [Candidatus Limnocylindria bacterium]